MSDTHFRESLRILESIYEDNNTLRLGEVLQNAVDRYKQMHNTNLVDVSSKQVYDALVQYMERI